MNPEKPFPCVNNNRSNERRMRRQGAERANPMMSANNSLKTIRESILMSKTELARKASVSPLTISRIEKGLPCRLETQRKILLALGYKLSEKHKVFTD